ncbi:DUF2752 domain-containing protein [Phaeocystidibacter luteus]|uniref:DUF2752 domain-containing protein n=1 Tax=Phaeocystidibacter luteus TaxID=911197 RepID=A0A6N6RIN1_9FLAO|nr:DUF2752 domain-containing protein [Phaeocystidibacter luteus]
MELPKKKEFWIWSLALIGLFFMPLGEEGSLCLLHSLGFQYCPGCGIGRGIHHAMHGEFTSSFTSHPFAIPALLIILSRVITLYRNNPTFHTHESNFT